MSDSPRLSFLPGMSGRGRFWLPVGDELPTPWQRTYFDWPGLGDVVPSPEVSSFVDLVDLVGRRISDREALIAQSMGGVVAIELALRARDRVSQLVLCATSGGLDVSAFGGEDWRHEYRDTWPTAPAWAFERTPDLADQLATLDIPTLLIWANADPISPLAVGRRLLDLLPAARLVVIESDDHMFAATHPREIAAEIERHIS